MPIGPRAGVIYYLLFKYTQHAAGFAENSIRTAPPKVGRFLVNTLKLITIAAIILLTVFRNHNVVISSFPTIL